MRCRAQEEGIVPFSAVNSISAPKVFDRVVSATGNYRICSESAYERIGKRATNQIETLDLVRKADSYAALRVQSCDGFNIHQLCVRRAIERRGGHRNDKGVRSVTSINRVGANKSVDRIRAVTRIDVICASAAG